MPDAEPTMTDISQRQERLEDRVDQTEREVATTRERVSATEQAVDRLWSEVHLFRQESREDARNVTNAINGLTARVGTHEEASPGGTRIRQVEDKVNVSRGAIGLAIWVVGVGVPAGAATAYYLMGVFGN